MKAIPKEEHCSEPRVADYTGYHFGQCSRRGTMSEDGKPWCFQHAPSKVKARRAKSAAKWTADQARRNAPYDEAKRLRTVNTKLLSELAGLATDAEAFLDVADDRSKRMRFRESLMCAVRVAREVIEEATE